MHDPQYFSDETKTTVSGANISMTVAEDFEKRMGNNNE